MGSKCCADDNVTENGTTLKREGSGANVKTIHKGGEDRGELDDRDPNLPKQEDVRALDKFP
jgi:hypothetical protein